MAFPFPGQLPCRHAAPLSHTFSSMLHCPCMFDLLHKERERIDTNISCKQAIDAYWQPDPNRIQSFDMFVCEWYLTWQVLSERSLREVLFLCLGPWKSEILIQSVLKRAKPNKTISLMTLGGTSNCQEHRAKFSHHMPFVLLYTQWQFWSLLTGA